MAKRPHSVSEISKKNLKRGIPFSVDNPEYARECNLKAQEARRKNREKQLEIEKTVTILSRLLTKKIKNNTTGEEITQKEAMVLTLLNKAIVEKDLKAIEMILKILGDFDDNNKTSVTINQPIQINKSELDATIKNIMNLADEG